MKFRILLSSVLIFSTHPAFAQGGWYPGGDTNLPAMSDGVDACRRAAQLTHPGYYPDFILEEDDNSHEDSVSCIWRRQSSNTQARYQTWGIFRCPSGYRFEKGQCINPTEPDPEENQCPTADNNSVPSEQVGRPIDTQTGNVSITITDLTTGGARPLQFMRYFNHRSLNSDSVLGAGWKHSYEYYIHKLGSNYGIIKPTGGNAYFYKHRRGNRLITRFANNSFIYVNNRRDSLEFVGDEIIYTDANGNKIIFDEFEEGEFLAASKLISRDGYEINFEKDAQGLVTRIIDSFGKSINLTYSVDMDRYGVNHLLQSISSADGQSVTYDVKRNQFDYQPSFPSEVSRISLEIAASGWFELRKATYADGQFAEYTYQQYGSRSLLVSATGNPGMPDEMWQYDQFGRGILNELPGGIDRVSLAYTQYIDEGAPLPPGTLNFSKNVHLETTVTHGNGLQESYLYSRDNDIMRSSSYGQFILEEANTAQTATCAAANRNVTHDSKGYRASAVDAEGNLSTFVNDSDGRMLSRTDAVGTPEERVTTYQWHPDLPLPFNITAPNIEQDFTYDAQNRLTSHTLTDRTGLSASRVTTYTWLDGGLIDTIDGPLPGPQDLVDYDYDANGNISRITDETGRTYDILSVDAVGRPTRINDFEGVETTIAYNVRGWPTTITEVSQNAVTQITYTSKGYIQRIDNPDGTYLSFGYDLADRLITTTNAVGDVITNQYDIMSNLTGTSVTNASGDMAFTSQSVYDELNRLRQQVGGNLQQVSYDYDREDRLTNVTDPASNLQTMSWNALDQLTQMVDLDAGITDFGNREDDALTSVTDPENLTTTYTYNGFGDVLSMTSPDTGTTDYLVDEAGRTTRRTDARGQITDYSYDGAGRPLGVSYAGPGAFDQSWTYDGVGRLSTVTHRNGSVGFSYDGRSNITAHTRVQAGLSYAQTMSYDAANRMTGLDYPSGRSIAYTYDGAGRVSGLTMSAPGEPSRSVFGNLTYDGAGSLTAGTYVNGLALARHYDPSGRLTHQTVSSGVQGLIFTYDDRDNIVAITDNTTPSRSQGFGYDAMSRLTSASGAYGAYAYEYDLVGNRTRRTVNTLIEDYAYINGTHRLGSVTASGITRSFSYQPSGQLSSANDPGTATTFTHDPEGRVRLVNVNGVNEVVYTYDAFNLRVAKFVNAGTPTIEGGNSVHFIYDLEGRLIAEHDGSTGAVLREYVYYGLMPVAMVSYDAAGTASVYAVHTDQVNMPQKLTDAGGTVVHDRVTTPFGQTISVTGPLTQTLRFPGQRNDSETGLFQNWHRDYDTSLGRYVQSDPIGLAGGINTYAYVDGNPISSVDPDGRIVANLIGAAIGGGLEYLTNPCATWKDIALAAGIGAVGGGLSKAAFLRFGPKSLTRQTGKEWSHFVPKRLIKNISSRSIRRISNKRGGYNGSWTTPKRHFKHDKHRYPKGYKEFGDRLPEWLRPLDRIPDWLKGTAVGGAIASAVAGNPNRCEC